MNTLSSDLWLQQMAPQKVHLLDQLGDEVLVKGKDGSVKTASILELKDKTVGVYFSAHWLA